MSNAQTFCQEVQKKKDIIGDISKLAINLSGIGLIGKALDKLGSNNVNVTNSKSIMDSSVIQKQSTDSEQLCSNAVSANQLNYVDKSGCLKILKCDDMLGQATGLKTAGFSENFIATQLDTANARCQAILNGSNNQSNSLTVTQKCALDSVVNILSKAQLDSNLMAILQASQQAKGLLSSNSNTTSNCNIVNNNIDSETYSKAFQSCSNALGLGQSNIAECVGSNEQSNLTDAMGTCMGSMNTTQSNDSASNTASTSQITSNATASGLTTGMLLAILGIVVCCGAGYYYVTRVATKQMAQSQFSEMIPPQYGGPQQYNGGYMPQNQNQYMVPP